MKKCYFGLLLLFAITSYGQDASKTDVKKEKLSFELYPNPVSDDVVYITTKANGDKDIIIYDVFGKIVLQDKIKAKALNISKLVSGVYVLQVTERNLTMTRKLVVK